jgi:hypothetical protein
MGDWIEIDVGGGQSWWMNSEKTRVTIPFSQIEGISDEYLGRLVGSLARSMNWDRAHQTANAWNSMDRTEVLIQPDKALNIDMDFLSNCRGMSAEVDRALNLLANEFERRSNQARPGFIYVIRCGPYYKIGLSKQLDRRIKTLSIQLPHPVEVVMTAPVGNMYRHEQELHSVFSDRRMNGEWFQLSEQDLETIRAMYTVE